MSFGFDDIPDQSGKVAVVTGGNGGLGLETTRELARRGAHVVIGARNLDKADVAVADILDTVPEGSVEVMPLDLGSLASIDNFGAMVSEAYPTIDLLFNNAGVMATPEWETEEGFESQFGINHLGHFHLTRLLLPALEKSGEGRIVNTTSTARFAAGDYDLDNPHHRGNYDAWEAYGYSKLANVHFTLELNRRLEAAGSSVRALMADPGFAATDLQHATVRNNDHGRARLFANWVGRIGHSAADGALPQLRAGTDPDAEGGTLYRPRWVGRGAPVVGKVGSRLRKPSDLEKLWAVSEQETGEVFDVSAIVGAG